MNRLFKSIVITINVFGIVLTTWGAILDNALIALLGVFILLSPLFYIFFLKNKAPPTIPEVSQQEIK